MKKPSKQKGRVEPKSSVPYKRRTEEEMVKIVREIQSGLLTIRSACFKYGLCRNTLKLFIANYSIRTLEVKFANQPLLTMNDDQKNRALLKKVQQLTKELEYAKLKIVALDTLIKVAEEDLNIKLRKKRGTKQLKE